MTNYHAITKTNFASQRWQRYKNYDFAASDALAPLVVKEMPKVCMSTPIAFIPHSGAFEPAAIQGLQPGRNLFVNPDGRWISPYVPACYRGYPFALVDSKDRESVLCVDMDSGLIGDQHAEQFYDEQDQPSQTVMEILNFLRELRANKEITHRICSVIQESDLIEDWPITIKTASGDQALQGLYRINESRLNNLDADTLKRIQQSGALPVVYCQLLSMQHIQSLAKLAAARAEIDLKSQPNKKELDLAFLSDGGSLDFSS